MSSRLARVVACCLAALGSPMAGRDATLEADVPRLRLTIKSARDHHDQPVRTT
jgi:hypothetical protein